MIITRASGMRWLRLSGLVGASQLLVQAISALTGVMLVQVLTKADYALITIAGSLLATLGILADGGISSAITSMTGRAVPDRRAVSSVIRACVLVRNKLAWLSLVLTLPPFYLLLRSAGLGLGWTVILLSLSAVTLWAATDTKFLAVPLRIMGDIQGTQKIDMAGGVVRLLLTSAVVLAGFGRLMPAFVATLMSIWVQSWLVHYRLRANIDPAIPASADDVHQVTTFVKSLYANHIFFCVQSQVATWIISWSSGVEQIADVGALGRLMVTFSILAALFHYLVMPNLAATRSATQLRWKFVASFGAAVIGVVALVFLTWIAPSPFLWVLGKGYYHLDSELTLAFAAQGIAFANSILWIFLQIRGWVDGAWLNIPLTLLGYAIAACCFSLNTVAGVLFMSGTACLPSLLWVAYRCWCRMAEDIRIQATLPNV